MHAVSLAGLEKRDGIVQEILSAFGRTGLLLIHEAVPVPVPEIRMQVLMHHDLPE